MSKAVIAVFEDPNCGYCKRFHKPILSPDSTEKARDIWCSADQAKTRKDWMVRGTPAIFFTDGTRSAGALPLETLQKRLK